jgi:cellulose synthase/poly-beta-1,6-N-acetylglucosamine synthase-like glycosyltransferase
MQYKDTPYFHVGRASDLTGRDRLVYRLLEMIPAILAVGTIVLTIILSRFLPVYASIFIIIFDLYWLLKTIYLSAYLRHNWKRTKHNLKLNWMEMLEHLKYEHIYHMIILPFYSESKEVIEQGIKSLLDAQYDHSKLIVVLAAEEKRGNEALEIGEEMKQKYGNKFGHMILTVHPQGQPGEMAGKGSNISFASKLVKEKILDTNKIPSEDVIVSAFDIDTIVYPQYFLCLTWYFLTTEDPHNASYQPVPFFNNNIWDAPALSRVVAGSGTFWQMIQQERPEKLATFSSHAISFKTLEEVGYWQKNMVSEDSRIFWNALMAKDGNYRVVPISYPVSMDANLAPTFWQTMKNIYKQQRRWMWGVENVPYVIFNFIKNKKIPLSKKIRFTLIQIEGFWSMATNPLMILLLGWLPLILGGREFNNTILSYNLPIITRNLMILAMSGLVISAIIFFSFLPQPKTKVGKFTTIYMFLQWLFIPLTIVIFGAIPALDAQIRLFLGKYLGFWVTPKHRKN